MKWTAPFALSIRAVSIGVLLAMASGVVTAAETSQRWITYKNEAANLVFDYPSGIFTEQQDDPTEPLQARTQARAGRVFTTPDGTAILQIGTFPNLDNTNVDELKKRAITASYSDAKLNYNRTTGSWYAISGTRGSETFYERVHFSCNNRRLDLWSLTYPTADSELYDDIVEEMAKRFRPILASVRCPSSDKP